MFVLHALGRGETAKASAKRSLFLALCLQMNAAVSAAREAFPAWRNQSVATRMRVMLKYQVRPRSCPRAT